MPAESDRHAMPAANPELGQWWHILLAEQPLPAFVACRDGKLCYANPAWQGLFDMQPDEASGLGWLERVIETERHGVQQLWLQTVAEAADFSCTCTLTDGQRVFIRAYPLPPGDYYSGRVQRAGGLTFQDWVRNERDALGDFNAVIDNLPVSTAIYDAHGHFHYINKAFVRQFGYDIAELPTLARWWEHAFPDPDYRQSIVRIREHLLRSPQLAHELELRVRCKNGEDRIVHCQRVALKAPYDGLFLSSMVDLTDLRQQQCDIAMRELRYRLLFDHAEVSLWNLDCSALFDALQGLRKQGISDLGRYLANEPASSESLLALVRVENVNARTLSLFELAPATLPGVTMLFPQQDQAGFAANLLQAFWAGERFYRAEATLQTRRGNPVRVVVSLPIPQSGAEALSVPASVLDLTDITDLENDLRLHSLILENMLEGVHLVSAETGCIVYANPRMAQMFGYSQSEMLGMPVGQLNQPGQGDVVAEILAEVERSGSWHGELRNVRKNGEMFWTRANVATLEHTRLGKLWVTSQQDITQRRLAKQMLAAKSAELSAVTRIQAEFIEHHNAQSTFEMVLAQLLELTGSEFGFVGEVLHDAAGKPYLKTQALSNIAWDSASRLVYQRGMRDGVEFRNLDTLFGAALTSKEVVIANSPQTDPRRGGLPAGHPALSAFMALPVMRGDDLVGLVGVANRAGGYSPALAKELEPVLVTYGQVIQVLRTREAFRKASTALAQAEQRWKFAIEGAGHGVWDWNLDTGEIVYSDTWVRMLGYEPGDLPGDEQHWRESIHPEDREAFSQALSRHMCGETLYYNIEHRLRCQDGSYKWVSGRGMLMPRDKEQGAMRIIGTLTDISASKRTEQALQANQSRLASMIDAAMDAIVTTDADFRIIVFNPAAEQMFGYRANEMLGQPLTRLLPEDKVPGHGDMMRNFALHDGATRKMRSLAAGRQVSGFRSDGSEFPVEVSISYSTNYGEPIYTAMIRDITERKAAEEEARLFTATLEKRVAERTGELDEARLQAEAANRAKSAFLAAMSHEIRTPLNSVLGMAHLTMQTRLDDKQRDYLQKISVSGTHLLALINDILDFSKIEAGKLELDIHDFDLTVLLQELANLMEDKVRMQGLEYKVMLDPRIPRYLLGDVLRLRQILLNLLGNAVKFTEKGAVTLAISLAGGGENQPRVQFAVSDTGIGIDRQAQKKLFQSFQQADNSTARKYGGTGLGLTISYQLVQHMGGELTVASQLGKGSTFSFILEMAAGSAPADSSQAEVILDYRQILAGRRILLADDHPFNQQVGTELLENVGISVDVADSGRQAVAMASNSSYDLILMDMQMPNLDGVQATEQLRAMPELNGLPIIAMTANASTDDRERCFAAGMNDFVVKPIEPERLYKVLAAWLGGVGRKHEEHVEAVVEVAEVSAANEILLTADCIDEEVVKTMLGTNLERQRRYFDKFRQVLSQGLPVVEEAWANDDAVTVAGECHRMKSVARTVGAMQLGNLLDALEMEAKSGELLSSSLLAQLRQQFDACCQLLLQQQRLTAGLG